MSPAPDLVVDLDRLVACYNDLGATRDQLRAGITMCEILLSTAKPNAGGAVPGAQQAYGAMIESLDGPRSVLANLRYLESEVNEHMAALYDNITRYAEHENITIKAFDEVQP